MWHSEQLLIDGDLVAAEGGKTYPTDNPATGEVLGTAADASVGDTRRAIDAARRAFDKTDWSTNTELRQRVLRQLNDAIVKRQEDLRELVVTETGLPISLTRGPGVDIPISFINYYADLLDSYEFTKDLGEAESYGRMSKRWVEKEPVGVVSGIVPYNYPVQISLAKFLPALAAGCTVVLKGPPQCPWTTAALGEILADTEIPPGVINILTSSSVETGELLASDPAVDMVSITSSTPVGRRVMEAASATVKKVFLELGGKSSLIMLDDADPAIVAMLGAFTITSHAGQGCAITSRLLVPQTKHDEVVEQLKAMLEGVPYGDPHDEANMMGPLISEAQREKVEGYVKGAVDAGGTVVTGGKRPEHLPKGYFYEPTLVTGVESTSAVAQDELFGPVLVVLPYKDEDEAVDISNNTVFGLSGSVLSSDNDRATAIGRRMRAGTISINGGMWYGADSPFGGFKQSGIGREMGVAGLEEYLEGKTLALPVE